MKVQLATQISIVVVDAELPHECPECGGLLSDVGVYASTLADRSFDLRAADAGDDDIGDDIEAPYLYQCGGCGAALLKGEIAYPRPDGAAWPAIGVGALQPAPLEPVAHERCSDGCRGWAHFNIGEDREHIELCDECSVFADDEAAAIAHANHCSCGADADRGCQRCHSCARPMTSDAEAAHHTYGVAPRYYWNEQIYCSVACAVQQGADARDVAEQL